MTVERGKSQTYFSSQFLSDAKTTGSYFLGPTSISIIMTISVRNIIFGLFSYFRTYFSTYFLPPLLGSSWKTEIFRPKDLRLGPFSICPVLKNHNLLIVWRFFTQVPVQRVTKYPLLLSRLYKVTPYQHEDRSTIKLSQERIEAALEQMNKVSYTILLYTIILFWLQTVTIVTTWLS